MKYLFINNEKLSYRYVDFVDGFVISINDDCLYESTMAERMNMPLELLEKFLKEHNAIFEENSIDFGRGYTFKQEKDIQNCIKFLENYLLSEKIKGSNLILEYKDV